MGDFGAMTESAATPLGFIRILNLVLVKPLCILLATRLRGCDPTNSNMLPSGFS